MFSSQSEEAARAAAHSGTEVALKTRLSTGPLTGAYVKDW